MLPEFTHQDLAAALQLKYRCHTAGRGRHFGAHQSMPSSWRPLAGWPSWPTISKPAAARFVRLRRHAPDFGKGSIFIRPDPRPERLQWAVAHEIGESRAADVFRRLGVRAVEAAAGAREMVANASGQPFAFAVGMASHGRAACSLGSVAAQAPLRHGQSRADRSADARLRSAGDHHGFRPRSHHLAKLGTRRTPAPAHGRGTPLLAADA